jgi:methionyl-tRNA formyltransferase
MKYIFFGTPWFSKIVLEGLVRAGMPSMALICNPDRPVGRKKIITGPPTKQLVTDEKLPIKIFQPEKLDADFIAQLRALEPDFFVVFAYNKILRKDVLDIPRLGTIGFHPSFLPRYRGPSPFQTALLNGELETGVTLYLLDEGVDSGPIIATTEPVAITNADTFNSLARKLAEAGGALLVKTLPAFNEGQITPVPQDNAAATLTKKFTAEDGFVKAADLAAAQTGDIQKSTYLDRKIRALNPEPGVWTMSDGKRIKLLKAEIENGALRLTETQREGERPKSVGV